MAEVKGWLWAKQRWHAYPFHWPLKKSRPGRLAGRSMPRCCCHVLHATERARHSRSSVGIPRHSLQLPCETTQSLVESNRQGLPNCKPRIEQVLRRNGKGMSERPSRNERSEPGPLTARASKDDQRRCPGAGCGQGQMTLWPSGQGVGLLSRWGLPAWVRIPQASFEVIGLD